MPDIDVVDSTWIAARPAVVAAVVSEPANWRRWWPDLDLQVDEWRGEKGVRWTVRRTAAGHVGSMEIWLEPAHDGVVAHYFLRLDAADGAHIGAARARRVADRQRRRVKQALWRVADELDPGRIARVAAPPGA
ncbi:MAG TPA: polyketide cyclase / dehydrase and lipid transport [Jatrophihabitantaceae bacterium]